MYVWYSKSTSVTGKALAQALQCECGIYAPRHRHDVVITWGAVPKTVTSHCLAGKRLLNDPFVIRKYTNKYLALIALSEHDVSVPRFSRDPSDLQYPMVRRTDRHSGGRGFEFFSDSTVCIQQQYDDRHFIEYIHNDAEYRVHVFKGDVIKVSRKKPSREGADQTCRSHANGWYFSKCDVTRVPESIKEQAIKAVVALGYDFGAVDIIYNRGGNAYVLEVNSGMGLDNSGLAMYASRIVEWSIM